MPAMQQLLLALSCISIIVSTANAFLAVPTSTAPFSPSSLRRLHNVQRCCNSAISASKRAYEDTVAEAASVEPSEQGCTPLLALLAVAESASSRLRGGSEQLHASFARQLVERYSLPPQLLDHLTATLGPRHAAHTEGIEHEARRQLCRLNYQQPSSLTISANQPIEVLKQLAPCTLPEGVFSLKGNPFGKPTLPPHVQPQAVTHDLMSTSTNSRSTAHATLRYTTQASDVAKSLAVLHHATQLPGQRRQRSTSSSRATHSNLDGLISRIETQLATKAAEERRQNLQKLQEALSSELKLWTTISSSRQNQHFETGQKSASSIVRRAIAPQPQMKPSSVKAKWAQVLQQLQGVAGIGSKAGLLSFPIVAHCGLLLALASSREADDETRRMLLNKALDVPLNSKLDVSLIQANSTLAVVGHSKALAATIVSFSSSARSTTDMLVDPAQSVTAFEPELKALAKFGPQGELSMHAHEGFSQMLEDIKDSLSSSLRPLHHERVVFVGHGVGGALAQLAAAHFAHMKPLLLTFGAPAVGDQQFCEFAKEHVSPFGGLHFAHEEDLTPSLSRLVGLHYPGSCIQLPIAHRIDQSEPNIPRDGSVDNVNVTSFQIGEVQYVFPLQ